MSADARDIQQLFKPSLIFNSSQNPEINHAPSHRLMVN